METIAVYWEPRIKTYGFNQRVGLTMVSLLLPTGSSDADHDRFNPAVAAAGDLVLTFAVPTAQGDLRLNFLLDEAAAGQLTAALSSVCSSGSRDARVETGVELVHFNGPHFGDRYGIADAALQALRRAEVRPLGVVCASASVYIVLPRQTAEKVCRFLAETFDGPGGCNEAESCKP
jgi:hypothetical protein